MGKLAGKVAIVTGASKGHRALVSPRDLRPQGGRWW